MSEPKGPFGLPRLSSIGPLAKDTDYDLPETFEPPKVTDSNGSETYWSSWVENDVFDSIPARLRPVTGVYYPELNWVVADDRINVHHLVQEVRSEEGKIPNFNKNKVIPFAHGYINPDNNAHIVEYQGVDNKASSIRKWESLVKIPETGSSLFADSSAGSRDVTPQTVYSIAYALFSLGVEGNSKVTIETERDVFPSKKEIEVDLDNLYSDLSLMGLDILPEVKFSRNNNLV